MSNDSYVEFEDTLDEDDFGLIVCGKTGSLKGLFIPRGKEDEEIPEKRRVFNFGDTKESVDEQLYEYDLALQYKENKVTG